MPIYAFFGKGQVRPIASVSENLAFSAGNGPRWMPPGFRNGSMVHITSRSEKGFLPDMLLRVVDGIRRLGSQARTDGRRAASMKRLMSTALILAVLALMACARGPAGDPAPGVGKAVEPSPPPAREGPLDEISLLRNGAEDEREVP